MITHASLFTGIGGFDIAAEWIGWTNVFTCEIDPFCRAILKYQFPKVIHYEDIQTTDFTIWRGRIKVLSGGFPCQPFSVAGKRKGIADSRYLWPEMLRAIRQIKPEWVIGENVLGIINWNEGLVFEQVCADLETEGYEVQPYILPAAGVGAPHRRYRVWFVAKNSLQNGRRGKEWKEETETWGQRNISVRNNEWVCSHNEKNRIAANSTNARIKDMQREGKDSILSFGNATYSYDKRLEGNVHWRKQEATGTEEHYGQIFTGCNTDTWSDFPTQSPIRGRNDGIPDSLDGISLSKWCEESIKTFGNAVVPQVAFQLFKAIDIIECGMN